MEHFEMAAQPNATKLAAYGSVAAHGGVAAADRHKLILMLMDGALERMAKARGCIERKDLAEKAKLLNRAVSIIGELRSALDYSQGGSLAQNLGDLYEYMCRRLLVASNENRVDVLDEVSMLLKDIRGAWDSIPKELRR